MVLLHIRRGQPHGSNCYKVIYLTLQEWRGCCFTKLIMQCFCNWAIYGHSSLIWVLYGKKLYLRADTKKTQVTNEIGLRAQCIATNTSPIVNTLGKTFCDHLKWNINLQILHLNSNLKTWNDKVHNMQFRTWNDYRAGPMLKKRSGVGSAHNRAEYLTTCYSKHSILYRKRG